MISPFKGKFRVTCIRGNRILFGKKDFHGGLDLVGDDDTGIYSVADGTVYTLYEKDGFGYYVRQHLSDGKRIYYGHMKKFCVKNGTFVKKGELIGIMGSSGYSFGAHLHLELRDAGTSKESLDICEFTGIPNKSGSYTSDAAENIYSYDDTVDELMRCGIVDEANMQNWELMLSGRAELKTEYVRILLGRCCEKIRTLERNCT